MTPLAWLGVFIVLVLLVSAMVALVRLLSRDESAVGKSGLNLLVLIFAAIGVLAVLAVPGAFAMHWAMPGMMG